MSGSATPNQTPAPVGLEPRGFGVVIPEHEALRWESKSKEACAEREPQVGVVAPIADMLIRAVPRAEDRRACVIGALLEVWDTAIRSALASQASARAALLDGLRAQLERDLAKVVSQAFTNAKTLT